MYVFVFINFLHENFDKFLNCLSYIWDKIKNNEKPNILTTHNTAAYPIFYHRSIERKSPPPSLRTTQMFAHDVKKPFNLLKIILDLISKTEDPNKIRELTKKIIPELKRSIVSVDSLLEEMLELGKSTRLITEPTIPQSIIETSLNEVFKMYPSSEITFYYDLKHWHTVNVDMKKFLRVFSNIIDNAAQAMKMRGEIWFSTTEKLKDGRQFVEFSIKNSGSFISEEDRDNVFEEFFTKGKKGGTGLGLAIVKKIIQEHGGKIWCHSERNSNFCSEFTEFTEFTFTLPIHTSFDRVDIKLLPKRSNEIFNI